MSEASKIHNSDAVEWRISQDLVPYPEAVNHMETRAKAVAAGEAREQIWLLEHPPLYSAGTSAKVTDLVDPTRFDVFESGRGGQYTYHGPGQRVGYRFAQTRARCRRLCARAGTMDYRYAGRV